MGIIELFKGSHFFFKSIIVNFKETKALKVVDLSLQKNTPITIQREIIELNP